MKYNHVNIITLLFKERYSLDDIKKLYNEVKENLTIPFTFYCYTDRDYISDDIKIINLKDSYFGYNVNFSAKDFTPYWYKLEIFKENFGNISGRMLYLDIDTHIQNNIDDLVNYGPNELTTIISEWTHHKNSSDNKCVNSSIMTWTAGYISYIWDTFLDFYNTDPIYLRNKFWGDDQILSEFKLSKSYFPQDWIYGRKAGINYLDYPDYKKYIFKYKNENIYIKNDCKICILSGCKHNDELYNTLTKDINV